MGLALNPRRGRDPGVPCRTAALPSSAGDEGSSIGPRPAPWLRLLHRTCLLHSQVPRITVPFGLGGDLPNAKVAASRMFDVVLTEEILAPRCATGGNANTEHVFLQSTPQSRLGPAQR